MNERENARHWEENAADWVRLVRRGFDESRDLVDSPAFMAMLPEVQGRRGLDLGGGEGHNTRLVAARGARLVALDVASAMVQATADAERQEPRGIRTVRGSGSGLPFADEAFDFVVAFMSLMDMPDHARVLAEVHRVLRPGGFFQFSMTHPCFQTPMWEWLRDANGKRRALVCGDYFRELHGEVEEWNTLETWLNLLLDAGFVLERFCEPTVDEATVAAHPSVHDHRIIAYFLQVRVRKPAR